MLNVLILMTGILFLQAQGVIITNTDEVFLSHPNVSLPHALHQFLYTLPESQRCIVIGDVHGCYENLLALLEKANYTTQDVLIFVGDMLDRGPKSYEVLQFIQSTPNTYCIRGNHEDDVINAYYMHMQGYEVSSMHRELVQQMSISDLHYLEQLPYTLTVPSHRFQVVHAGYLPGKPFYEQHPYHMVKLHTVLYNAAHDSYQIERNRKQRHASPWAKLYSGAYHVYFGHDSKRDLQLYKHATGLDTGCVKGHHMTAMLLPQKELVQVKCETNYINV